MNAHAYWYATRGAGVVALLLLTASVALGVLTSVRWKSGRWPRFAVTGLHRNLTLLAVAFVAVHVVTTVLDGYAPVGLRDAVVPFVSPYRPLWLGLGAVAFDLLLALVASSLLRLRLGLRLWRATHWLAYACWPVALVHGLGTGSDARLGWLQAIAAGCVVAVVGAVLARVAFAGGDPAVRLAAAGAALAVPLAVGIWYVTGPGAPGWARRAGTPTTLLASARTRVVVPAAPASSAASSAAPAVRGRFSARLAGSVHQEQSASGLVTVVVAGKLHGGPGGATRIDLRGQPLGGGVALTASGVSYVPAAGAPVYTGAVTALQGERVAASLTAPGGHALRLVFDLALDGENGTASGVVRGVPGGAQ